MKVRTLLSAEDKRKRLTIPEVAQALGFKAPTVYEWIRKGKLPAIRPGGPGRGSRWYVNRDDLEIYWQNIHQAQSV